MNYDNLNKAIVVGTKNQIKSGEHVRFENLNTAGPRILFVGNSITFHGRYDEIGWHGEWGMAASSKDKDYVHLVEKHVTEKISNASFGICNVADWEREYKNGETQLERFADAREFDADVIIIKISANSPRQDFDSSAFAYHFDKLIRYFNKSGNAKIIIASEFFAHPAEPVLEQYALHNNYIYCKLSDLSEDDTMRAIGLFEHSGVANHPGDDGMSKIADRIIQCLTKCKFFEIQTESYLF